MLFESAKKVIHNYFVFLVVVLTSALLVVSNFSATAMADSIFVVTNATVSEKSDGVEGEITQTTAASIEQNIVFHKVGDSVKFIVTIQNTSESEFEIETITVGNENEYIDYTIGDYSGTTVAAGGSLSFDIEAIYAVQLDDINEREQASNAKILIKYVEQEEPEVIDIVTPDTGDNLLMFGAIMIFSVVVLAVVVCLLNKNRKTIQIVAITIIALTVIVPSVVFALDDGDEIGLAGVYALKDRLVVTTILDGDESKQIVNYGDKVGQLEKPQKVGYSFSKWTVDGEDCDDDVEIKDDMAIMAVMTPNTNTPYKVIHKLMNLDGESYSTKKTIDGSGTTDTRVTPSVDEYDGFIAPAAQTAVIAGDGSTVIEYLYERDMRTLALTDAEYIDSEFTSGDYFYETNITLKAKIREGYAFVKWSNGATDEEISFDLLTDTEIGPIYEEDGSLHPVFELDGACEFHGASGTITGCEEYAGQRYIDTGVALFSRDYYDKDFYISFDIDSINVSNLEHRATLISATLEDSTRQFPGIVLRRDNSTSNFLFGSNVVKDRVKLSDKKIYFPISEVSSFAVIRKNMNVCYSVNGGDPIFVNNYNDFNEFIDLTTTIGAAIENDAPIRFFTGTLSNVVIKLGADVHDSVACEEN